MDGATTPRPGGGDPNSPACGPPQPLAAAPLTPAPASGATAARATATAAAGETKPAASTARKAVSFELAGRPAPPARDLEAAVAALAIGDNDGSEEEEEDGAVDAAQLEAAFRADGEGVVGGGGGACAAVRRDARAKQPSRGRSPFKKK